METSNFMELLFFVFFKELNFCSTGRFEDIFAPKSFLFFYFIYINKFLLSSS